MRKNYLTPALLVIKTSEFDVIMASSIIDNLGSEKDHFQDWGW